jgi:hypothetical protein
MNDELPCDWRGDQNKAMPCPTCGLFLGCACTPCKETITCACGASFNALSEYWEHSRRVHPDKVAPTINVFQCTKCNAKFKDLNLLRDHQKICGIHFECQSPNPVADSISEECDALKELLLNKNKAYGNSALDPVRIFSKCDSVEQIKVRIDDKLSRLMRGSDSGEDVVLDLLGYLILLRISQRVKTP